MLVITALTAMQYKHESYLRSFSTQQKKYQKKETIIIKKKKKKQKHLYALYLLETDKVVVCVTNHKKADACVIMTITVIPGI